MATATLFMVIEMFENVLKLYNIIAEAVELSGEQSLLVVAVTLSEKSSSSATWSAGFTEGPYQRMNSSSRSAKL